MKLFKVSRGRSFIPFMMLAFIALPMARGAIRPSFYEDYSIWKSSDIVVATEGEAIDGRLRVLECWKGKAKPDDEIIVPELAQFASDQSRQTYLFINRPTGKAVTGKRMILFLVRKTQARQTTQPAVAAADWQAASYWDGGFTTSVAWVEEGRVWAMQQVINPGPVLLSRVASEVELHANVAGFCVIQDALDKAIAAHDPAQAEMAFREFTRKRFHYAAQGAIDAMARSGLLAMPTLRDVLEDPTLDDWHEKIVPAVSGMKGDEDAVRNILADVVEREIKFWQAQAARVGPGWWNAEPHGERRELRNHYSTLHAALVAMKDHRSTRGKEAVRRLQSLWESHENFGKLRNDVDSDCIAILRITDD
jgi:hypothetical protein